MSNETTGNDRKRQRSPIGLSWRVSSQLGGGSGKGLYQAISSRGVEMATVDTKPAKLQNIRCFPTPRISTKRDIRHFEGLPVTTGTMPRQGCSRSSRKGGRIKYFITYVSAPAVPCYPARSSQPCRLATPHSGLTGLVSVSGLPPISRKPSPLLSNTLSRP